MKLIKFMSKTKFFTLIELIVVIVVLGILAAIVIPNISSLQEEAEHTSIASNVRNLQTSVDMFVLESNGVPPTKERPALGNPQTLEIHALHPEYTRDLPKNKGVHWWLDHSHTVWASFADAPQNIDYVAGKLTWDTVEGAQLYRIYKSDTQTNSSVSKSEGITKVQDFIPSKGVSPEITLEELSQGVYLVSSIDKFGFESAKTKMGSSYKEYQEPDENFFLGYDKVKPTAVISVTPQNNILTTTNLVWSYGESTTLNGYSVVDAEWENALSNYSVAGTYEVKLRVKDSRGLWSAWVSKVISVEKPQIKPTHPLIINAIDESLTTYDLIPASTNVYFNGSISGKKISFTMRADSTCYVSDATVYAMKNTTFMYPSVSVSKSHSDPSHGTVIMTVPSGATHIRFLENEGCNSGKSIKLYDMRILE